MVGKHAARGSGRAGLDGRTIGKGDPTRDRGRIRAWAEARGGRPSVLEGDPATGDRPGGILRFIFGNDNEGRDLREVSWDEFFAIFEDNSLAVILGEQTRSGKSSRSAKFVSHEGKGRARSKNPKHSQKYELDPEQVATLETALLSDDIAAAISLDLIVSHGIDMAIVHENARVVELMVKHNVLPKSTLQHNTKRSSGRLSAANSERFVRAMRLRRLAANAFGEPTADVWLETPLRRFGGRTAMQLMATEAGARAVEQLIGRTMHGFNA